MHISVLEMAQSFAAQLAGGSTALPLSAVLLLLAVAERKSAVVCD
jgi:hypothetical protein